MKDVYGRPIYRLERTRGNQARYQNSETAQWTPWVRPEKSEVGFPVLMREVDMGMLLYARAMRRGMRRVTEGMQAFSVVIRKIGEKLQLDHPEVLTSPLDAAIARHPASIARKQMAGMHHYQGGPSVQEFDLETTDEEVQHRIELMGNDDVDPADELVHLTEEMGLYDITDDEIARAGAEADHPGLATITPLSNTRTLEQLNREEELRKMHKSALIEIVARDRATYGFPPGGVTNMLKANLVTWIVQHEEW